MEVSSHLISFCLFLFFIFLVRPTVEGSLFPSTMNYHHHQQQQQQQQHPFDDLIRLDNWLPDPFKVLEHLPIGLERDDEVMISSARADWKETPQSHVITLDVPGFRKDELKIEENNRVLSVSGERKRSEDEQEEVIKTHWHCLERSYGKFIRQFRLPEDVDLDSVNAKLENGVLTITIPKLSPDRVKGPKVIPVSGATDQEQLPASSKLSPAASNKGKEEL